MICPLCGQEVPDNPGPREKKYKLAPNGGGRRVTTSKPWSEPPRRRLNDIPKLVFETFTIRVHR